MTTLHYFSLYLPFFVLLYVNHRLVAAEPFIGDNVIRAENGEFPSVVSLGKAPASKVLDHLCTGTLISKKHVLTSAHCVAVTKRNKSYMKPGGIVVTVGSIDVTQGTKYQVQEWTDFKQWAAERNIRVINYYNLTFFHDIAVVTLVNEITENIKPAHLTNSKYKHVYKKTVVSAGWGTINDNTRPLYLRKAYLKVLNRKTCLRNLIATDHAPESVLNNFCTIARPPISLGCGDSGGPVFVNGDELLGVNDGDCANHTDPNQQNLHTAVKFYRKFITAIIDPNSAAGRSADAVYNLDEFYNDVC